MAFRPEQSGSQAKQRICVAGVEPSGIADARHQPSPRGDRQRQALRTQSGGRQRQQIGLGDLIARDRRHSTPLQSPVRSRRVPRRVETEGQRLEWPVDRRRRGTRSRGFQWQNRIDPARIDSAQRESGSTMGVGVLEPTRRRHDGSKHRLCFIHRPSSSNATPLRIAIRFNASFRPTWIAASRASMRTIWASRGRPRRTSELASARFASVACSQS